MTSAAAFEVIGAIGGVSISLSLVPQVIYTYKTKSVGDISYAYQCFYIFGCTLTNSYAIGLGLWPIYAACLLEQSLIMTLTFMKYKYEKEDACAKHTSKKLSVTIRPSEEDDDGNEDENDDEAAVDVEAENDCSSSLPQSAGLKNEGGKRRQLMNSMGHSSRLGLSTSWLREVLDESPNNENAASEDDDEKSDEAAVNNDNDVEAANNESSGNVSQSPGHKKDGDKRRQLLMNSMGKSSRHGVSTLWLNAVKDAGEGEGETAKNSGDKRRQLMNSMGKSSRLGVSTLWNAISKDSGGGGDDATVENSDVKRRQLVNSMGKSSRLGLNATNDSEEKDSTSKGSEEICAADA
mmetsp:Transcript_6371/g.9334  ORF Transcript_6371/g.9334 Transcript_6371/m.9334 type:complete len:350 (+) Transcript_6371:195-1244(+)